MLLDVGERLGDVLEHDRLDGAGDVAGQAAVVMRLDPGPDPHRLQSFADRTAEIAGQVEGLGADIGEQPAQRVLDLSEGQVQIIELNRLWAS